MVLAGWAAECSALEDYSFAVGPGEHFDAVVPVVDTVLGERFEAAVLEECSVHLVKSATAGQHFQTATADLAEYPSTSVLGEGSDPVAMDFDEGSAVVDQRPEAAANAGSVVVGVHPEDFVLGAAATLERSGTAVLEGCSVAAVIQEHSFAAPI